MKKPSTPLPAEKQPLHLDDHNQPLFPNQTLLSQDLPHLKLSDFSNKMLNPNYPGLWLISHQYKNGAYAIEMHLRFYKELHEYYQKKQQINPFISPLRLSQAKHLYARDLAKESHCRRRSE